MNRLTLSACIVVLTLVSCNEPQQPATAGPFDLATVAGYFSEFDALCEADDGNLWSVSLCGPILLVDPPTRTAVANESDAAGVLAEAQGVFAGELPPDVPIANTAVDWGGNRWTNAGRFPSGTYVSNGSRFHAVVSAHRHVMSTFPCPDQANPHLDATGSGPQTQRRRARDQCGVQV